MVKKLLLFIALLAPGITIAQNVLFQGQIRRTGDLTGIPGKEVAIRDVNDPGLVIWNQVYTQSNGNYFISYTGNPTPTTLQVVVVDCNGVEVVENVQFTGDDTTYNHTITICHTNNCSADFFPHMYDTNDPNHFAVSYQTDLIPTPNITLNWGDGTQVTGNLDYIHSNNDHVYSTGGYKNICLTINNGTCNITKCVPQWVGPSPGAIITPACSTSFEYGYTGYDENTLEYYVQATAPADTTLRYQWFVNGWPLYQDMPIENSTNAALTNGANEITLLTYKTGCYSTTSQVIPADSSVFGTASIIVNDTVSAWAMYELLLSPTNYNMLHNPRMYSGVKNPVNLQLYEFITDFVNDTTVELHSASLSPTGTAHFNNADGIYIGRALFSQNSPEYGIYMPTYLGYLNPNATYEQSVTHWYEAYYIGFGASNIYYMPFSYTMLPVVPGAGPGQLAGTTDWQDTLLRSSTVVEDVTVWAQNIANGKIYGYDITDANGSFTIGNLPYGTYYIDADYPGYYSTHDTITISAGNEVVNDVHIEIMEDMPTIGIAETGVEITALYPNPTSGNTTLVLNTTKAVKTSLQIINMMGQTVYSENLGTLAGKKTVELTTQHLPAGIYYVTLYSGNNNTPMVKKLIKF